MNREARERDYYRSQVAELGSRVVELQDAQIRLRKEVRRSRMTARLIASAFQMANADLTLDQVGQRFLRVILETLTVDRAAILSFQPSSRLFVVAHALGFPAGQWRPVACHGDPPAFFCLRGHAASDRFEVRLQQALGAPCLLWNYDAKSATALVLGNVVEDRHLHPPFEEADREIVDGALAVYLDVVARKRTEMERVQLVQKTQALGTLAGGIAHDFNNILQVILGYAQLAVDEVPSRGRAHRWIKEILIAGKRGAELVGQILTFSRRTEQERKPIRLQPVIKEALKLLRGSLPKSIELVRHIDEECGPVLADPTRIHQVLMNLCTNAYHAMREQGGTLEVTLTEVDWPRMPQGDPDMAAGRYARLTVRDTGKGMDRAVLDRIFEPYFTTKQVGEGTGLGLPVVQGIVQSHDGSIRVRSEPGKGSTFEVCFPLCGQADAGVAKRGADHAAIHGRESILFIDDEEQIARLGGMTLEALGYRVKTRTSSLEALEAFRANPSGFDAVVTDQTMPNMSGLELARRILEIRPDMPIIVCTGFSETLTEHQAREQGIREYIRKPILAEELARAIRHALDCHTVR